MYVLTADYEKPDAAEVFVKSLKETGFGVVKNHPVNYDLVQAVFNEWVEFFASPDKFNYLYDKETLAGYFPQSVSEVAKGYSVKDIKEFYHVYPGKLFPASLSQKTFELYDELSKFAETLLSWIEAGTPEHIRKTFSMKLADMITHSPRTALRVLHYPALTGDEEEGAERAAAHEDINLLTVLPAATTTGLQVKDMNNQWHDVDSEPGTMVMNVGDMLQECTQNYFKSTTHRVINPRGELAKQSRYSMPLFLHPRDEVILSTKHTARSYHLERLRELGIY